jgi:4-hydroxybenzoate polyprenyltransferase
MIDLKRTEHFFSLVKFSHTVFAMPFALTGFFWTLHETNLPEFPCLTFVLTLLCMVFARNAAMAFNRYIDREYDAANPRTANREIPAGIIRAESALIFVILNSVLFCLTTSFINTACLYLSIPALLVVLGYSYTKRFTFLCHFILGLGLSMAPAGACIALTGTILTVPLCLSVLVLLWVGGFDILYALPDDGFDKTHGLHSIPAFMGRKKAMILSASVHFLAAIVVLTILYVSEGGILQIAGSAGFILLLVYQHLIISPNNLKRLGAAFGLTNGIASIWYAAFAIADFYLR